MAENYKDLFKKMSFCKVIRFRNINRTKWIEGVVETKSVFPKDAQEDSLTDVFSLGTSFSSADKNTEKNAETCEKQGSGWQTPGEMGKTWIIWIL